MNAPVPYHGDMIPLSDLEKMAAAIAKSGLFGMKEQTQALALMLTAQAEGQHPATITQDYDIIQGRATRKTHSVLSRYQQAGGSVEWHELTNTKADATFTPPAGAGKPLRIEWTLQMAKDADLTGKDNWRKYPRAMLRARCIAEGVRATYPAAIGGMMIAEEVQDLDLQPEKVIGSGSAVEMPRSKSEAQTESAAPAAAPVPPPSSHEGGGVASDPKKSVGPMKPSQVNIIRAKLKAAGLSEIDLGVQYPGKSLEPKEGCELFVFEDFNTIAAWIVTRHGA